MVPTPGRLDPCPADPSFHSRSTDPDPLGFRPSPTRTLRRPAPVGSHPSSDAGDGVEPVPSTRPPGGSGPRLPQGPLFLKAQGNSALSTASLLAPFPAGPSLPCSSLRPVRGTVEGGRAGLRGLGGRGRG